MSTHDRRLIDLAKTFLREYFADGVERQPSTLEDEIVGGVNTSRFLMGGSQWGASPFAAALGELVAEDYVRTWHDDYGWHYQRKVVS